MQYVLAVVRYCSQFFYVDGWDPMLTDLGNILKAGLTQ